MNTKTKKILIISIITTILSVTSLVFLVFVIKSEGRLLEEQIHTLSDNNSKESSYLRMQRLVTETEEERALLAAAFFAQEGDSIKFLGEIESLAKSLNLKLTTEALDKVTDAQTKTEAIKITFTYSGERETVLKFSKLMEVVPYHSVVDSLALRRGTGSEWEGQLTILITLNSI